jgi:hypothetical protein
MLYHHECKFEGTDAMNRQVFRCSKCRYVIKIPLDGEMPEIFEGDPLASHSSGTVVQVQTDALPAPPEPVVGHD